MPPLLSFHPPNSSSDDQMKNGGHKQSVKSAKKNGSLCNYSTCSNKSSSYPEPVRQLASYLRNRKCKDIIIMAGAGISTASGIPDFRSPGTGLYYNTKKYNVSNPSDVFDLKYFNRNPHPFLDIIRDFIKTEKKPNLIHSFCKTLETHGLLLRMYTQNIDGLEKKSGISSSKLVEAHGTLGTASCCKCFTSHTSAWTEKMILQHRVPSCKRKNCSGYVKPDVIMFGEELPKKFYLYPKDFQKCDLLIIMGTSLNVEPFSELVDAVPSKVPRVLLNRDPVGPFDGRRRKNDIFIPGDIAKSIRQVMKIVGWTSGLNSEESSSEGSGSDFESKTWACSRTVKETLIQKNMARNNESVSLPNSVVRKNSQQNLVNKMSQLSVDSDKVPARRSVSAPIPGKIDGKTLSEQTINTVISGKSLTNGMSMKTIQTEISTSSNSSYSSTPSGESLLDETSEGFSLTNLSYERNVKTVQPYENMEKTAQTSAIYPTLGKPVGKVFATKTRTVELNDNTRIPSENNSSNTNNTDRSLLGDESPKTVESNHLSSLATSNIIPGLDPSSTVNSTVNSTNDFSSDSTESLSSTTSMSSIPLSPSTDPGYPHSIPPLPSTDPEYPPSIPPLPSTDPEYPSSVSNTSSSPPKLASSVLPSSTRPISPSPIKPDSSSPIPLSSTGSDSASTTHTISQSCINPSVISNDYSCSGFTPASSSSTLLPPQDSRESIGSCITPRALNNDCEQRKSGKESTASQNIDSLKSEILPGDTDSEMRVQNGVEKIRSTIAKASTKGKSQKVTKPRSLLSPKKFVQIKESQQHNEQKRSQGITRRKASRNQISNSSGKGSTPNKPPRRSYSNLFQPETSAVFKKELNEFISTKGDVTDNNVDRPKAKSVAKAKSSTRGSSVVSPFSHYKASNKVVQQNLLNEEGVFSPWKLSPIDKSLITHREGMVFDISKTRNVPTLRKKQVLLLTRSCLRTDRSNFKWKS